MKADNITTQAKTGSDLIHNFESFMSDLKGNLRK